MVNRAFLSLLSLPKVSAVLLLEGLYSQFLSSQFLEHVLLLNRIHVLVSF